MKLQKRVLRIGFLLISIIGITFIGGCNASTPPQEHTTMTVLKSSIYDSSSEASLYIIQGSSFNDSGYKALESYLTATAPQTLLVFLETTEPRQDYVKNHKEYTEYLLQGVLSNLLTEYNIDPTKICLVGYEAAGALTASLIFNNTPVPYYLLINPELQNKIGGEDIVTLENEFFSSENHTITGNICILRSEDDTKTPAFTRTTDFIESLSEHAYEELVYNDQVLQGAGHHTIDCEALLRGICYFSQREYSEAETSCVDASKAMTDEERRSISIGKLSENHEYYEEVVEMDPTITDYIQEITMYDDEINDSFVIHLSLPPTYDINKTYPLVLLTDGVWRLGDHIAMRQWMESGTIEDVIVVSVGYPNSYDYSSIRNREFLMQPDLFLQYITENLVPYLFENYAIDPEQLTLMGHSNGGYWGFYALLHQDTIGKHLFSNYLLASPIFNGSTNGASLNDYEDFYSQRNNDLNANVYIPVGSEEDTMIIEGIEKGLEDMALKIFTGYSEDYEVLEGYTHTASFKPALERAMIKFHNNLNF